MRAFALFLVAGAFLFQGDSPVKDVPVKYRPAAPAADAVVARVNGVEIKAGDVEPLLWDWRGSDAIQDVVTYQVIKSEAQKQRLDVSEADVERSITAFLTDLPQRLQQGMTVEGFLGSQGLTRSRLYVRFRTELLLEKMIERSFNPKSLVKVSTLIFRASNSQTSAVGEAIKQADAAYDRLRKGETWEAVLKSTTTDQNILRSNGMLGWRELTAFPEAAQKELADGKKGDITKPVQTPNGIQIFRVEASGKTADASELQDMKTTYMNANRNPLLERLKREARIDRVWVPPTAVK
jgi:parvulin-like peptidyl-prolyl isomerase